MINIAKLLENAPDGMKLYSPLFGEVKFVRIDKQSDYPINVTDCKGNGKSFTEFGVYFADHPDAECLLFPSKDCRTWEGWKLPAQANFKIGAWVVYNGASVWQVDRIDRDMLIPRYELTNNDGDKLSVPFTSEYNLKEWTIRDSKDGDVLVTDFFIFLFKKVDNGNGVHYYCHCGVHGEKFDIALSDSLMGRVGNTLINYRPATKEQRELLFKKMKEAGYEWDADNKELRKIQLHYDINNFHAGMPVLVRADNNCRWDYSVFSRITGNEDWPFAVCNGVSFTQCIPFEGNEYLLGTTDMCPEEYINW